MLKKLKSSLGNGKRRLLIIGIMIAPLFWILSVGHAGWHLRKELMVEHADMIATKMAEKLAQNQKQ